MPDNMGLLFVEPPTQKSSKRPPVPATGGSNLDGYCARMEKEIKEDMKLWEPFGKAFVALIDTLTNATFEKVKNKALTVFLESIQSLSFCVDFYRWDGGSSWAYFFNQIGQYLGRPIFSVEFYLLMQQCEIFAKSLTSSPSPGDPSLLASSLFDHLSTHRIDPCNFLVGAHPSALCFQFSLSPSLSHSCTPTKSSSPLSSSSPFFPSSSPSSSPSSLSLSVTRTASLAVSPLSPPSPIFSTRRSPSASSSPMCRSRTDSVNCDSSLPSSSLPFFPTTSPSSSPTSTSPHFSGAPSSTSLPPKANFEALLVRWGKIFSLSPHLFEHELFEMIAFVQRGTSRFPGELVAVPVEAIPPGTRREYTNLKWMKEGINNHIYCRLKKWQANAAEVWISPAEDCVVTIPPESVVFFDWEKIESIGALPQSQLSSNNCVDNKCVVNPMNGLHKETKEFVISQVKESLQQEYSISLDFENQFPGVESLPSAFKNHKKFSSVLLSKDLLGVLSQQIQEDGDRFIRMWLETLPKAHKEANKQFYLKEIVKIQIQIGQYVIKELKQQFMASKVQLFLLRKKMLSIADGSRKNTICRWWLKEIEERVNKYLQQKGFKKGALPTQYMSVAPPSVQAVENNLEILIEWIESEEVKDLVEKVTKKIYVTIDQFLEESEYFLLPSRPWFAAMGFEGTTPLATDVFLAVQKDLEYLRRMKEMDKEIIQKRKKEKFKEKKREGREGEGEGEGEAGKGRGGFEMTDVVPVAGLVMARFTMYECEHSTALELWGKKKKTDQETRLWFDQVLTLYADEDRLSELQGELSSDEEEMSYISPQDNILFPELSKNLTREVPTSFIHFLEKKKKTQREKAKTSRSLDDFDANLRKEILLSDLTKEDLPEFSAADKKKRKKVKRNGSFAELVGGVERSKEENTSPPGKKKKEGKKQESPGEKEAGKKERSTRQSPNLRGKKTLSSKTYFKN